MIITKDDEKITYFNTLIFTIIAAITSLIVLGLLFFTGGKEYIYFIVVFEIGLFTTIAFCIYQIVSANKNNVLAKDGCKSNKAKELVIGFNECPDYFVKRLSTDKKNLLCVNEYTVRDKVGNVYIMRITPAYIDGILQRPEDTFTPINDHQNQSPLNVVRLNALKTDSNFKDYGDKCPLLFEIPQQVTDTNAEYLFYSQLPWTHLKSRCESFGVNK